MFSTSQIDHVAWLLFLLMAGWVVVNALVDLTGDRTPFGESNETADERSEPRD